MNPLKMLLNFDPFFSAPGSSRTIISHERFSKLKGKENLDASFQEKELTCVDTHTTSAQPTSIAVILLTVQWSSNHLRNVLIN